MDRIELIKAEIERLKGKLIYGACASQLTMETNCKEEAYNEILFFIDSLQEEPSIPDIVDEHFDEMFGEEPVSKVWHDANERPQKVGDRVAWVDKRFGIMHAGWYNKSAFGHEDMRDYACKHSFEEISKWAYTDDLLNLSTVERNGKNLKELKTMLDVKLPKEIEL